MNYYLTYLRWVRDDATPWGCFAPPPGTVGMIDLTNPAAMPAPGSDGGLIFAAVDGSLPGEDSLSVEDLRESRPSNAKRSQWQSVAGFRPTGDTLADWISSHLLNGDPLGLDRCFPLQPTRLGELEVWVPGHGFGPIQKARFTWGGSYTNRLRDLLRTIFLTEANLVSQGKKTVLGVQQFLDDQTKKYPGLDWKDIVPKDWHDGPSARKSTYTDTFTASDGTQLTSTGTDLGVYYGSLGHAGVVVQSNEVSHSTASNATWVIAPSDVASNDNWTTIDYTQLATTNSQFGPLCRGANGATTGYYVRELGAGFGHRLERVNAGTTTLLQSYTSTIASPTVSIKVSAIGSTITGDRPTGTNRTSVTDTNITTGTRGGVYLFGAAVTTRPRGDNLVITDGILRVSSTCASVVSTANAVGALKFSATSTCASETSTGNATGVVTIQASSTCASVVSTANAVGALVLSASSTCASEVSTGNAAGTTTIQASSTCASETSTGNAIGALKFVAASTCVSEVSTGNAAGALVLFAYSACASEVSTANAVGAVAFHVSSTCASEVTTADAISALVLHVTSTCVSKIATAEAGSTVVLPVVSLAESEVATTGEFVVTIQANSTCASEATTADADSIVTIPIICEAPPFEVELDQRLQPNWFPVQVGISPYGFGLTETFGFKVGIRPNLTLPFQVGIADDVISPPVSPLGACIGNGTVLFAWEPPEVGSAMDYEIWASLNPASGFEHYQSKRFEETHGILTNLPMRLMLYFKIRARNHAGTFSEFVSIRRGVLQEGTIQCRIRSIQGSKIKKDAVFLSLLPSGRSFAIRFPQEIEI